MNKIIWAIKRKIRGEMSVKRLVKAGLKIGKNVSFETGCKIDPSFPWHVEIGNNVIFAPKVHIVAHDTSTYMLMGYVRVANVKIGNNVFIGIGTIILPGTTIGDNVVIGAGSVIKGNIPDNSVAVGVPARVICPLDEYLEKEKNNKNAENTFSDRDNWQNPNFPKKQQIEMYKMAEKWNEIFVNISR